MTKMNKLHKYLSWALLGLTLAAAACDDDEPSALDSSTLIESIRFDLADDVRVKLYTDHTGTQALPLVRDERVTLSCTVVPDPSQVTFPALNWTSSDTSVATVTPDGVVTALAAGTAVITVAPETVNLVATASLKVNVVESVIRVTSISITDDAEQRDETYNLPSCYIGEKMHLTAAVQPAEATYQTVMWSSSDPAIATIDPISGEVTGLQRGRVTMTATALDEDEVTADHEIYIDQIVTPLGVKMANTPAEGRLFSLSEQRFTFTFDTYPTVSTRSLIEWTTSDATIATVSRGAVTFHKYGKVTISATCGQSEESLPEGFARTFSYTFDIPAGYYNEHFVSESAPWWVSDTNGAVATRMFDAATGEYYLRIVPGVQNASNFRGDMKRDPANGNIYMTRSSYPILCLRMDDVADRKAGVNRSIFLDVNNGYVDNSGSTARIWFGRIGGGGQNKWAKKYKCSDGSAILVYDLETQTIQNGGQLTENAVVVFPSFKIGYADIRPFDSAEEAAYRLFWFHTFTGEAELGTYLNEWSSRTGITFE